MSAPDRAELVVPGQGTVGVVGDVGNGEIVDHEGVRQAGEGETEKGKLTPGGWLGQAHPLSVTAPSTDQRQRGLDHCQAQRQNHRQMAELGNHFAYSCLPPS